MMGDHLEHLKAWAGVKLNGLYLAVDLMNMCPMRCPTCPVGALGRRSGEKMSIETFRKVLDVIQSQVKIRKVQLYSYSDSALVKDLHLFIRECRSRGLRSCISTTLQAWACDWEKVIEEKTNELRLSYTGPDMERYQTGCSSERFLKNLELLNRFPRYPETRWSMFYHIYKTNQHQTEETRKLAERNGLDFIPYPAIFLVNERIVEKNYSPHDRQTISLLLETPEENIARRKMDDFCILQSKQLYIDAGCNVYLCQILYEQRFIVGNLFDFPLKELRRRIAKHDFCLKCKKAGGHKYCEIYDSPMDYSDPVKVIGGKYK